MNDQITTYHANGKLLLSGEYFVIHGAKALALPLKRGQQLTIKDEIHTENILWNAFYKGRVWFWCQLNPIDFSVVNSSDPEKGATLSKIFQTIYALKTDFHSIAGMRFETILEANPDWGFGTSSTLISLLSQWSGVDPFNLNELVFNGSGFDIACAQADGPIIYIQNQSIQRIELDYPFADQLMLIYSGNKKKTQHEVQNFRREIKVSTQLIDEVSALTDEFAQCTNQNIFNQLIREHEKIVGQLIGQTPVKEQLFADFQGEVKSLGAWGGDFYLISGNQSIAEVKIYFEKKGFTTNFRWTELILIPATQ